MLKTLAAAALLVALAGCNNGSDEPAQAASTVLDLRYADGDLDATDTLRCNGDSEVAEACAALDEIAPGVFDPVDKDQACTMMYGGPQTLTIKGTYENKAVSATYNRTNGCEIARWESIQPVLKHLSMYEDLPQQAK